MVDEEVTMCNDHQVGLDLLHFLCSQWGRKLFVFFVGGGGCQNQENGTLIWRIFDFINLWHHH